MSTADFSADLQGLVLSLQVYLQKGDLQSLKQEMPALQRAALALKTRHEALAEENEQLKSRLAKLERRSKTVQISLMDNLDAHKAGLEAFHRFKDTIEIVQKMRSLRELPDRIEELRHNLKVDYVGLALRQESFSGFVPEGIHLMPDKELDELAMRHSFAFQEGDAYIGPVNRLHGEIFCHPRAGLLGTGLLSEGSCFLYRFTDKYRPDRLIGFLLLLDGDPERYTPAKATDFLEHFCRLFGSTLVSVLEHEKLDRHKTVDGLTGAYNREYLRRHAGRILDFSMRKGFPVSLLFMDLDGFKAVNDILGHKAGDRLLQGIVQTVSKEVRRYDIFVRLGGDEFVILLPGTGLQAARQFKERLVRCVEAVSVSECAGRSTDLAISASVGVAAWNGNASLEELLQEADQAMYEDKRFRKGQSSASN